MYRNIMYNGMITAFDKAIAAQQIVDIADAPVEENFSIPVYPIEPAKIANYKPAHIEAHDAIMLAAMWMKRQYDAKHKPMFFTPGDYVTRGY
jgi:hypothetical protein